MNPEIIVAAAIRQNGIVFTGPNHAEIIHEIATLWGIKPVTGEQGFITSDNRFVDREAAAKIALETGQIKKLRYGKYCLYSEDVWPTYEHPAWTLKKQLEKLLQRMYYTFSKPWCSGDNLDRENLLKEAKDILHL